MDPRIQQLPFFHLLTSSEQQALTEDSSTGRLLDRWDELERYLKASIAEAVPDRHLLVLYALSKDFPDDLDRNETDLLRKYSPKIDQLIDEYPGLALVVERIREDRAEFEVSWGEHFQKRARIFPLVSSGYRWATAIAATIIVAFALIFSNQFASAPQSEQVVAAENGQIKHRFDDGSTVLLDEGAHLTFVDSEKFERKVHLSGAAFFDVTHDPERPFEVETEHAVTRVLGTQFAVHSSTDETEVVLASGRVEVRARDNVGTPVILAPGQKSTVALNSAPAAPSSANLSESLAWSGYLFLGGMTMAEAVERISAEYSIRVQLSDEIRSVRLSSGAVFERTSFPDARSLLEVLAGTVGASLETVETDRFTMQ